ncbi:MAG: hypothetical protein MUE73_09220 [Planctomycetes bacterium]|nr:hypothetical protein [Planctomycetota bacterium]
MSHEQKHDDHAGDAPHAGHDDPTAHDAHGHHGDVRNPDYDGPDRHCLPPDVHASLPSGIIFILLMVALAAGAAWLGVKLL